MPRVVVVSNRVALPGSQRPGGLAIALRAALREGGGLWFGWSGRPRAAASGAQRRCRDGGIDYCAIDLDRADVQAYYRDFANRVLWPLLHSRIDLVDYGRECSAGYRRVNALFARLLARELRDDDLVWVHDYHLLPLARELRRLGIGNRIGFFLHVPFPSADVIASLPGHAQIFAELDACDLLGFQTAQDLGHAGDYLRIHAAALPRGDGRWLARDGRLVEAGAFPVGIDTGAIAAQAAAAVTRPAVERLRTSLAGRRLAIGVDRLDYSKGLPERLRGFERHLLRHGEQRGRITLLQIATPSRNEVPEYRKLRREVETLAGHINGAHALPDWTPVRYVNQDFGHDELTGFYRQAEIGLVTPLRDGMNLVAKEYVASQSADSPGVLVLSRFAGAACELGEALLVNPHDPDEVADAIAIAAAMPLGERRERWRTMMRTLRRNDIDAWRRGFLQRLAGAGAEREPRRADAALPLRVWLPAAESLPAAAGGLALAGDGGRDPPAGLAARDLLPLRHTPSNRPDRP